MKAEQQSPRGSGKKIDDFFLHLKNGRRFLQNNNLVEAKDEFESALELRPDDDKAQNLLAMVLFKLEQYPRATEIFRRLIERNPRVPTLHTNLGLGYIKQEKYDQAIDALLKAVEAQPGNEVAHNYLGLVYSKLGRYGDAREEFIKGNSQKMAVRMEEKLAEIPREQEGPPQMEEEIVGGEEEPEEKELLESQPQELPKKVKPVKEKEEKKKAAPAEVAKDIGEIELKPPEEKHEQAVRIEETVKKSEIASLKNFTKSLEFHRGDAPILRMIDDNLFQIVLKGGEAHARLTALLAFEGNLIFEPEFKKFKGNKTGALFGTKDNLMVKVSGEGQLLFSPSKEKIHLFSLEDELLYLVESVIFAFQEEIDWENGRIHGEGSEDLNLVQFKGRGIIALATKSKLVSIQLDYTHPLLVDFSSLTGWYGKILPKVISLSTPSEGGKGKKIMLELNGEGYVLVEESPKS